MDNLSTHNNSSLYETFSQEGRLGLHKGWSYTCTLRYGSLLDMAEIELSTLTDQPMT